MDSIGHVRPTATEVGKAARIDDAVGRYVVHLKSKFPQELTLEGVKIALDCANGAAYKVAPAVFEELGAEVIKLGVAPNGENINRECGSLHPEKVARAVKAAGAHIGISLDGDADRLIVVDEKGEIVDGDRTMAICARAMKRKGVLARDTVVATVMSNLGLERSLAEESISLVRTDVGDRYVVERMREGGFNFGGEQSGHLIFLDHATTGDGTLAALQLLGVMVASGRPVSELAGILTPLPQVLKNALVRERRPLAELAATRRAIAAAEETLGKSGRVLVRYSGTEAKLRVMIEGEDETRIGELADGIIETALAEIGSAQ